MDMMKWDFVENETHHLDSLFKKYYFTNLECSLIFKIYINSSNA